MGARFEVVVFDLEKFNPAVASVRVLVTVVEPDTGSSPRGVPEKNMWLTMLCPVPNTEEGKITVTRTSAG